MQGDNDPPGFTNGANLWSWQPLVKCRQGIGSISNRHCTPSAAHVTGWQWIAVRRFRSRGLPDRLLPGFVETFCGAGLLPGPAIRTRRRATIRRFLRLSSHLGGLTLIPKQEALSAEFCRIRASRSVDARVTSFGRRNGGWIAQKRRPPRSGKTWPRWLSPWVDLTSHHPLDRIRSGCSDRPRRVAPSPKAAVAHICQAGSRTAVP